MKTSQPEDRKKMNKTLKQPLSISPDFSDRDGLSLHNPDHEKLQNLRRQISECRICKEEFGFEPRPVTWGNPDAKILHISQAPGRKVHEIGRPFSDLSGKTLRNDWYQISEEDFYDPDQFYFTTMAHCFPGKGNRGNYDRKPPKRCFDLWTRKEIELMKDCQLILVVGSEAASRLFPNRKLSELVFEDLSLNNKPCYVLPHPSPLNRIWLKNHPEFEKSRLPEIRKRIHEVLSSDSEEKEKDQEKDGLAEQKTEVR